MATEPKGKTLDDLTTDEQMQALQNFRAAVRGRLAQWDHERAIEKLLDREIELDVPGIASCCDTPGTLTLNDLREALEPEEES